MFFHKTNNEIHIGDRVKTTVKHECFSGYFKVGSMVTVIDINDRGYDIQDDERNRIREIGWII